jgi:hypothetical protein
MNDKKELNKIIKENKKNIINFTSHENHKFIRFDPIRKQIRLTVDEKTKKEIALPGIKQYLKEIFFPDYEYVKKKGDASSGVTNMDEGIERGEIVHGQLEDYFNLTKEEFIKNHSQLHFYTSKAIISLKKWDLKPLFSEICVYNKNIIGTKLDAVCTNDLGEFILIEWKTGGDGYFLRGNAEMRGVLKGVISNNPLNQSLLQLLVTRCFIEKEYNVKVHDSFVAFIQKDGVIPEYIPDTLLELKDIIYEYFIQQVIILKSLKYKMKENNTKTNKKKKTIRKRKYNKKKKGFI